MQDIRACTVRAVAATHGSERNWPASDEEMVNRGDWSFKTDACAPATRSEHTSQANAPTIVDVDERERAGVGAAAEAGRKRQTRGAARHSLARYAFLGTQTPSRSQSL